MRAVFYESHGGVDVLQYGEQPRPDPDEVLVQVAAAGVNPIDRRLRAGELTAYIQREFPVIPGWDFSDRIVELGSETKDWKKDECGERMCSTLTSFTNIPVYRLSILQCRSIMQLSALVEPV